MEFSCIFGVLTSCQVMNLSFRSFYALVSIDDEYLFVFYAKQKHYQLLSTKYQVIIQSTKKMMHGVCDRVLVVGNGKE